MLFAHWDHHAARENWFSGVYKYSSKSNQSFVGRLARWSNHRGQPESSLPIMLARGTKQQCCKNCLRMESANSCITGERQSARAPQATLHTPLRTCTTCTSAYESQCARTGKHVHAYSTVPASAAHRTCICLFCTSHNLQSLQNPVQ